jgi:hypothetical protein
MLTTSPRSRAALSDWLSMAVISPCRLWVAATVTSDKPSTATSGSGAAPAGTVIRRGNDTSVPTQRPPARAPQARSGTSDRFQLSRSRSSDGLLRNVVKAVRTQLRASSTGTG